ncbi:MAG TPA: biotin--[acetyl-CoA-carboxylase] ligase [Pyrinomonadaceae bacterium]|jgi:BirA family biotin operon repressor/biotin-[acetyl-CoA-carboxylase] ligase|nr:biotin--[acetyl-CoA-carboxylase] ligase [Pyrinomonadaceae bacterium]
MTHLKPRVLRYESLPSTNTELSRLASEGAEEGVSVVADEQTAGRGRLQRAWSSPKGAGLYFSILLRPKIPTNYWPLITMMAAVAVYDTLGEACRLQADIKWPNDLLSGERKICGILAEAIDTPGGRAVIVGIGVNLTEDAYPTEIANIATSVSEAMGRSADREAILASLLRWVAHWYVLLNEPAGAESIVNAWSNRSSYAFGRLVQVSNGDEVWKGTTSGIERDGALRLCLANGEIKLVRAGDVHSVRPAKDI